MNTRTVVLASTFALALVLPMNGIYILENMGPSRITGAVQAIINPIAIK
jgi:hypothetical protein